MPTRTRDGIEKRCTCSPRKWAKCAHPWHFSFYHAKREYGLSLDVIARKRGEPPPVGVTEAKAWRDRLRAEIRNGADPTAPPIPESNVNATADTLTVGDVMTLYVDQHVRVPDRKPAGQIVMIAYINRLRAMQVPAANGQTIPLEKKTLDAVTAADLDVLRARWTLSTTGAQGGRTGPQRALKRLRHFFNWAIEKGHTERSPFKRGSTHVNTMHFSKEPGRTRRLEGDEETRLFTHATTPLLKLLITAGLDTGCRIGELLHLRWRDVKWESNVLLLPAEITKTNEPRDIPLTQNLRALLDMRKYAPDGTEYPPDASVFGNEIGEPVKYWRVRQAWTDTCTLAGITGLHFHDLRRELASTLRESGAPDHIVADVLGHANISTTSRYLKASRSGLTQYVQRFEVHRRETAQAKKKAAKKQKARRIRTPFAHGGSEGRTVDAVSTVKRAAKSLN